MTSAATEEQQVQFEVLDHNVAAGYVTLILDIWTGKREDLAAQVERYIGVWEEEKLEKEDGEAFDPTYRADRYYGYKPNPQPLIWEKMGIIKAADREALDHAQQHANLLSKHAYSSTHNQRAEMYQAFLLAIDKVAEDDTDEEAWTTIEKWRKDFAMGHER